MPAWSKASAQRAPSRKSFPPTTPECRGGSTSSKANSGIRPLLRGGNGVFACRVAGRGGAEGEARTRAYGNVADVPGWRAKPHLGPQLPVRGGIEAEPGILEQ